MDKTTYQRSHVSRRRKQPAYSNRNPQRRSRFLSFLLACAGIFVFVFGINYIFPHFSKAVGNKVSSVIDYRSALAVIGEGISGEKKLKDALSEAWVEAFNIEDEAEMTGGVAEPTPSAAGSSDVLIDKDNTEFTDALLAAFSQSQFGYADYMTPAGMDYGFI